jgi:hypothetical protein
MTSTSAPALKSLEIRGEEQEDTECASHNCRGRASMIGFKRPKWR